MEKVVGSIPTLGTMKEKIESIVIVLFSVVISAVIMTAIWLVLNGRQLDQQTKELLFSLVGSIVTIISIWFGSKLKN